MLRDNDSIFNLGLTLLRKAIRSSTIAQQEKHHANERYSQSVIVLLTASRLARTVRGSVGPLDLTEHLCIENKTF